MSDTYFALRVIETGAFVKVFGSGYQPKTSRHADLGKLYTDRAKIVRAFHSYKAGRAASAKPQRWGTPTPWPDVEIVKIVIDITADDELADFQTYMNSFDGHPHPADLAIRLMDADKEYRYIIYGRYTQMPWLPPVKLVSKKVEEKYQYKEFAVAVRTEEEMREIKASMDDGLIGIWEYETRSRIV